MSDLDLMLITLPPVGVVAPLPGPAMVYSAAKNAGFNVLQHDWNLEFYEKNKTNDEVIEWINFDSFNLNHSGKIFPILEQASEVLAEKIAILNPRWVGLSMFSYRTNIVLEVLLPKIRSRNPTIKIVLGGSGLTTVAPYERMRARGLIDAFVNGEGEKAIISLLDGTAASPGINGVPPEPIKNLNELPFADYSGLPLHQYGYLWFRKSKVDFSKRKSVFYIEGSRGCVRKCSFCDVPFTKPGFRFRSVESITSEIRSLVELYQADHIYFVDSLVNGALKNLDQLCEGLIKIKSIKPNLTWVGYMIVRGRTAFPPESFKKLARSGALLLKIGVESGSDSVRKSMNKFIADADIDYNIEECHKNGIGILVLLLIGYPTETRDDFEKTLDLIKRNQHLLKGPVSALSVSWKVGIDNHRSELSQNLEKHNIIFDINDEWYSPEVNILITSKRYIELCRLADELGIFNSNKYSYSRVFSKVAEYGVEKEDLNLSEQELTEIYLRYIRHNPKPIKTKSLPDHQQV